MKKNKKKTPIYLELYNGKVIEIICIENIVDPSDEYNKLYENYKRLYPEMPKA